MALLSGLVPTLLLGHIVAHHLWHVVARLSWFIPAFLLVNILAIHGRNISTLLFPISILGTHRLLYKITLSNCLSGTHTLSHSITHLLHTRLALSDQLLGAHSFIVGGTHFLRY